jgi:hypothetical protein
VNAKAKPINHGYRHTHTDACGRSEDGSVIVKEQRDDMNEIDPRLRALLITIRSALLMAADAIAAFLGLEKRKRD